MKKIIRNTLLLITMGLVSGPALPAIFDEVRKNNVAGVKQYLDTGVSVNARDKNGNTALHWAVLFERCGLAKFLLDSNANPSIRNAAGKTPLDIAISGNNDSITNLLLDYINNYANAYFCHPSQSQPKLRQIVAKNKRKQKTRKPTLSECQTYQRAMYKYANDHLFAAVEAGSTSWVGALLALKANPNCKTNVSQTAVFPSGFSLLTQGITPLHYAAICGNEAIVQLLIELGQANVNATDDWHNTPLHYAYACGYQKIVDLLIAKGANQNARDKHGYTPVQYSIISQNKKRLFTRNQ